MMHGLQTLNLRIQLAQSLSDRRPNDKYPVNTSHRSDLCKYVSLQCYSQVTIIHIQSVHSQICVCACVRVRVYICIHTHTHTGCPRRNVPDFGRMFLMLKYTDITQNTYVQSWTVTEIMAREKCGLLAGPRTVPVSWQVLSMFVLECGVRFSSH